MHPPERLTDKEVQMILELFAPVLQHVIELSVNRGAPVTARLNQLHEVISMDAPTDCSMTEGAPPGALAETRFNVRVVIVDDCRLNRDCLEARLSAYQINAVCAWNIESLLAQIHPDTGNVVLLSVNTTDHSTLLRVSLDLDPAVPVIVYGLAEDNESEIVSCAKTGVAGLHLKSESADHLVGLILTAKVGQTRCSPTVSAVLLKNSYATPPDDDRELTEWLLSPREKQILELLEAGMSNQQIASRLCVTLHTVKNHVHKVLTKMGVSTRAEAVSLHRSMRYSAAPIVHGGIPELPCPSTA